MKMKALLLLTIITFLTSCSSNDDGINITSSDLIGTWNLTEQTTESTNTSTAQGISITSTIDSYGKDFDFTYTFSEDPNLVAAEGSMTLVSTISIAGQDDTVEETTIDSIDGLNSGSWSLDGSNITFTDNNGQTSIAEVIGFTGSTLELKASIEQTVEYLGITIEVNAETLVTLEK